MSKSIAPPRPGLMAQILQWSGWRLLVPLTIMVIALIVLRDLSRNISLSDLRRDPSFCAA